MRRLTTLRIVPALLLTAILLAASDHARTMEGVTIDLRVLIDKAGHPKEVVFVKAPPGIDANRDHELIDAAIRVAQTWTYIPTRGADGNPVEAWADIPLYVDLADMPDPAAQRKRGEPPFILRAVRCNDLDVTSPSSKPVPAARFAQISAGMPVVDIVRKIGPAARDIGFGLHVLEWSVSDGRRFTVSAPDICGKAVTVGFVGTTSKP